MNRSDKPPDEANTQALDQEPVGIKIPEDHIPTFVSEVLSDVERDTDWDDVVDRVIAAEARQAWEALPPEEKVCNLLEMASGYDRRCLENLRSIPLREATREEVRPSFQDAMRCRKNAEILRDAIASAHQAGRIDDDPLVNGLEAAEFSTELIAQRERKIDQVTDRFDLDFRPYGGRLLHTDEEPAGRREP